jgi:hypothetical protein
MALDKDAIFPVEICPPATVAGLNFAMHCHGGPAGGGGGGGSLIRYARASYPTQLLADRPPPQPSPYKLAANHRRPAGLLLFTTPRSIEPLNFLDGLALFL